MERALLVGPDKITSFCFAKYCSKKHSGLPYICESEYGIPTRNTCAGKGSENLEPES